MRPSAQVGRAVAPFAAAAALGFVLVPIGNRIDATEFAWAAALTALVVAAAVTLPWGRLPRVTRLMPPVIFLVALGLLRDAGGGNGAGVGVLAVLPVFWLALHGTRRELLVIMPSLCLFFLAPVVLVGGPTYPASGWRTSVLFTAVSVIIGLTVHTLVDQERRHARNLATRERDLSTIADLSHTISVSADARERVCTAACELSEAHLAVLLERRADGGLLSTAHAGVELGGIEIAPAADPTWPERALASGVGVMVGRGPVPAVNEELFELLGRPGAILFEPVQRGDQDMGVLVVGWHTPPADQRRQSALIRLLAAETTFAIERADQLRGLTEIAMSDPLIGLPNRRAWDACLRDALRGPEPFCVAMIDLDRFKAFNDANGHQAGDRLLKEAAAAWRAQLRPIDTLARYGGEEFGLLLPGCEPDAALAIVERLRDATPHGQRCSAGIASREAGDDSRTVLERADQALYQAKRQGRNRSIIAGA